MDIILHLIVGIVGMLLGVKAGIEKLSYDLYDQNRISIEEHTYITSIKYLIECFKLK